MHARCRTLRAAGVCESVLYGLPLLIQPTTCWKLDWDEMEANHNLFQALCSTLKVHHQSNETRQCARLLNKSCLMTRSLFLSELPLEQLKEVENTKQIIADLPTLWFALLTP